jgi:hypothetical protein
MRADRLVMGQQHDGRRVAVAHPRRHRLRRRPRFCGGTASEGECNIVLTGAHELLHAEGAAHNDIDFDDEDLDCDTIMEPFGCTDMPTSGGSYALPFDDEVGMASIYGNSTSMSLFEWGAKASDVLEPGPGFAVGVVKIGSGKPQVKEAARGRLTTLLPVTPVEVWDGKTPTGRLWTYGGQLRGHNYSRGMPLGLMKPGTTWLAHVRESNGEIVFANLVADGQVVLPGLPDDIDGGDNHKATLSKVRVKAKAVNK